MSKNGFKELIVKATYKAANFYEMKLFDRERLSASQKNIEKFKLELENCRAGVETLKNN